MVQWLFDDHSLMQLISGRQSHPHKFLGLVDDNASQDRIVLFRPGAHDVTIEIRGELCQAQPHHSGIFSFPVAKGTLPQDYRVYHQNGLLAHDPYAFPIVWGDFDSFLFHQGKHYRIYERMGAIPYEVLGIAGTLFIVWAPHAQRVSVVGDFNFWNGLVNPLQKVSDQGVWELFVPGLTVGTRYKWEIVTATGKVTVKSDPYGKTFDVPPHSVAIVANTDSFIWQDQEWMAQRSSRGPISIYEVHLGSWRWDNGSPLGYREAAKQLAAYCKDMHYTHVELLPITEHPLNESWGYQTTGYYAPSRRYGSLEDFQWFVDHLHQHGIGVILDWVPGHFPTDSFAMIAFDGDPLYEYTGHKHILHPHWHTCTFNYGCPEVSNFLIGSALFWIDKMHIDGLRMDAVASMLYLNYGREDGSWTPNVYGGHENLDAIRFIQHLNSVVHSEFPGVSTFAEESTAFPQVTTPVNWNGLGFDYKWNLGWMHDIFTYLKVDPIFRSYHHNQLTFSLWYAFHERFLLPLSHDEVVHGKGSLLAKLPGDTWSVFAHMRLLLSYQLCQPGKKLLFMGGEFGQRREWSPSCALDWHLLDDFYHASLHRCVREINRIYLDQPGLWREDQESFLWVDFHDTMNNVISYYRLVDEFSALLCIHHFSAGYFPSYLLRCQLKTCQLLLNTDDEHFGGSGKGNRQPTLMLGQLDIELPPLATLIFKVTF